MDNITILPTLKIYAVGLVWWLWFLYQPFDWDRSIFLILISIVFYILYVKNLVGNGNRLIYILLTAPVFISISVIIVGTAWYLIAESI